MSLQSFLMKRGMSRTEFYSCLVVGFVVAGGIAYFIQHHYGGAQVAKANTVVTQPFATFKPEQHMTGVVIKNEETNLPEYYWVTFRRDKDKAPVTGLSQAPIWLGHRVHLVEAMVSLVPGAPPQLIAIVVLGDESPSKK
jgi:hypothetical protein